jgi:hypothetical protein
MVARVATGWGARLVPRYPRRRKRRIGENVVALIRHARTDFVFDAEQATRRGLGDLVHHSDRGTLADSIIGLFKTEVIQREGPWRHLETVEFATLTWVDWFVTGRLLEPIGYVPPAEYEASYYLQLEGSGARRHPRPNIAIDGTAAEHPQDFLPTSPNEGQMAEPTTNSH